MILTSTNGPSSIFEDGKLKSGIYKIQNLDSETYLDIHQHSKEVCCRPAQNLEDGGGLWEIKSFGAGYAVQRVDPGKPEQFCAPIEGSNGTRLYVNSYPMAWRIEVVNDDLLYRGFEYVRFYWGPTKKTWDLPGVHKGNGTNVEFYDDAGHPWQMWRLIPVKVEERPKPPQSSRGLSFLLFFFFFLLLYFLV